MDKGEYRDLVKGVPLFQQLPDDQLADLTKRFETREYKKGDILLNQGAHQDFAGIVIEGLLTRTRDGVLCDSLPRGHHFGLYHLLAKPTAYATVVAEEPSKVLTITSDAFAEVVRSSSTVMEGLLTGSFLLVRQQANALRAVKRDRSDSKRRVIFFDASSWTRDCFSKERLEECSADVEPIFVPAKLSADTAVMATGAEVISCFVNDDLSSEVLRTLSVMGVKLILMRCAGFDRVSIESAKAHGMTVARVPGYAPDGVAEHAVALLLAAVRNVHIASARTKAGGFSLQGLTGFNINGKTVGVIGVGRIGQCMARIMHGFGTKLVVYDPVGIPDSIKKLDGVEVVEDIHDVWPKCDIITLHVPLTEELRHIINSKTLARMKDGVVIVNVSRGALVDVKDLTDALMSGKVRAAGLDVFEGEEDYVFNDAAALVVKDPLRSLLALPNVVVSGHQAFLTEEALKAIRKTTMDNIKAFDEGKRQEKHPNSVY